MIFGSEAEKQLVLQLFEAGSKTLSVPAEHWELAAKVWERLQNAEIDSSGSGDGVADPGVEQGGH